MSSRATSQRQALACGLLLAGLALWGASCRGVVVGDSVDAIDQLCRTLQDCYGDELAGDARCDALRERLIDAPDAAAGTFLRGYELNGCGSSCAESRACLSLAPLCTMQRGGCADDAECCDASVGHAACVLGACCSPKGTACTLESNTCCDGDCRALAGDESRLYCGGQTCVEVGDSCATGFDCCTKRCEAGRCAKDDCAEVGQACVTSEECCPPAFVQSDAAVTIECVEGQCQVTGQACQALLQPCDPLKDGADCCDGRRCYPGPGGAVCVDACLPEQFDCGTNPDCCSGNCLIDNDGSRCVSCGVADTGCMVDTDCCSGSCSSGVCADTCDQIAGTCHSPCAVGDLLNTAACEASNPDILLDPHVAQVNAADPYCRCTGWDQGCVELYLLLAGACP